ncbi:hypothetical protein QN277_001900 [Acacia crassicarpa]|uniref:CCHC-type domain-containing protein n=1 Tax=Acacia crassicarpa TaxID=499986 RepID=A0AAE1N842_9FABA|nr:hypothetical protein QN277_001900 [Acacia crassicarpa]
MAEERSSGSKRSKQVVLDLGRRFEKRGGTLVGKILTGKKLNVPTVVSMIKKGWQLDEEVDVHDLDRNHLVFLFRFDNSDDYARILKGRPWSIQGHLLNLQIWEDFMVLKDVDFRYAPFWLQFHGLPLEAFDGSNAKILGDAVGETVMYEKPVVDGKLVRSFIRVRALLLLDAPLTTGFWVPRKDKDPVWVTVRYERLQNFCYRCGRIGHKSCGCKDVNASNGDVDDSDFGNWLSTPMVRTFEDILEVCKEKWEEAEFVGKKNQNFRFRRNLMPAEKDTQVGKKLLQEEYSPEEYSPEQSDLENWNDWNSRVYTQLPADTLESEGLWPWP